MDWRIQPLRHLSLHQVFLIASGNIELTLDGARLEPALPAVLNIPPGTVHGFTFATGTEGHVLTLPVADVRELFGPEAGLLAAPFCADGTTLVAIFDQISALHRQSDPLRRLRLRAAAIALICDLEVLSVQAPARGGGGFSGPGPVGTCTHSPDLWQAGGRLRGGPFGI